MFGNFDSMHSRYLDPEYGRIEPYEDDTYRNEYDEDEEDEEDEEEGEDEE